MNSRVAFVVHAALGFLPGSYAAVIEVDSTAVVEMDDGRCTVTEAIRNANTDSQAYSSAGECESGSGDDEILLPNKGKLELASGLPTVDSNITIQGRGSTLTPANGQLVFAVASGGRLEANEIYLRGPDSYSFAHAIRTETLSELILTNSTVTGFNSYYGPAILNRGTMTLDTVAVKYNFIELSGVAGIANVGGELEIRRSTIRNHGVGGYGGTGGLSNSSDGEVLVIESTISHNSTGGFFGSGGGISNFGRMLIVDSTLSYNTARSSGGAVSNSGSLTLENSTISENKSFGDGGALLNRGSASVLHSTFAHNRALDEGAALYNVGTLTLVNSLVADNAKLVIPYYEPMLDLTTISECVSRDGLTWNISMVSSWVTDGSCKAVLKGPVRVAALADNGGLTKTNALLAESGAIGAAKESACPERDQRGVTRLPGVCDLGAFEFVDLIVSSQFELAPPVARDDR